MDRNLNYRVGPRRMWKAEEFDGHKPTVYDWVRMAAFLDGEGTIDMNSGSRSKPRHIVRVLLGNTNAKLTLWLEETFGGNVILRHVKNPNAKDCYVWSCCAARAAWILHNCLPWFLLKGEQAKLMIELQGHLDQKRKRVIPTESLIYRDDLKTQLRKLNAKGRAHQVVTEVIGE